MKFHLDSTKFIIILFFFFDSFTLFLVLKGKPDFGRKPWPSISHNAKYFVKKLLVKDPRARLTAAQALSHPWVREGGDPRSPVDISVLSNMRKFVKYNRFKQFALWMFVGDLIQAKGIWLAFSFLATVNCIAGDFSHTCGAIGTLADVVGEELN